MSPASIREVLYQGDHYVRGLVRGRALARTLRVPAVHGVSMGFVRDCRDMAEAFYPPVGAEFEGIVEGGGFGAERMMAHYYARLESRLGCTMVGVSSERHRDAGSLVGRNYDWATEDLQWCELHRYRPPDALARVGYTHHWAGCTDVLNEAGLYCAIASLPPEPVRGPGVQWNVVLEKVTETCRGVDEAVEVCASTDHLRPMSYLLADAAGAVAVVEATPSEVRVREPGRGLVLAANATQGGRILSQTTATGRNVPVPGEQPRSYDGGEDRAMRRVRRALAMLAGAERIAAEDLERVLSDHEAPICTGRHERGPSDEVPTRVPWSTIWSGICRPADGVFLIAPGQPCRESYVEFRL